MSFPLQYPSYVVRDRAAHDFESADLFECALDNVGFERGIRQYLAAMIPPQISKLSN